MQHLFRACVLLLLVGLAPAAEAITVHLKDGATIDAQRVWQKGGTVFVQINKEDVVEFAPAEVDLKKTFGQKLHKGPKKLHRPKVAPVARSEKNVGDEPQGGARRRFSLPRPEASEPASDAPKDEGAIRRYNRELEENIPK